MNFRILLIALFIVLPAAHAFGQDWRTGYNAYRRGDYAEALTIFRALADRGDARAQNQLGVMYVTGRGVPKDYAESAKRFREAAEQGYRIGQYNLGYSYFYGEGVTRDSVEAVKWYRKAALQGYVRAYRQLGRIYNNQDSKPQDYVQAFVWYTLALESGQKFPRAEELKDRIEMNLSHQDMAEARKTIADIKAQVRASKRR